MKCKYCGSTRNNAELINPEENWLIVKCKKCGRTLWYNGA